MWGVSTRHTPKMETHTRRDAVVSVVLPVTIAGTTYERGEIDGATAIVVRSDGGSVTGFAFLTHEKDAVGIISVRHATWGEARRMVPLRKAPAVGDKPRVLYRVLT